MNVCTVAYLPPKSWGCSVAFHDNLAKYPTRYPLVLFSEAAQDWPAATRINGSPEILKGAKMDNGQANKFAINNLVFLTGMRVAIKNGFTHAIYLEADCRVGVPGWDALVFEEAFNIGRPLIIGGTVAVYNPCNHNMRAARRWEELVARNVRRNVPIATYGYKGAADHHPSCVFTNGALTVLDLAWIGRLFDLSNTPTLARNLPPWDMAIGMRIWEMFGVEAYDVVGHLTTVYSGYGDVLTTEAERIQMLRDGKVVAVHQVKTNVVI